MAQSKTEIDDIIDKTDLDYMIEFETQIFLDSIYNDSLVVAAKGLNLDLIILNLLKVYCDPGNLVLVLNATELEEKYFKEKLNSDSVHTTTFTTSTTERQDIYLSGGIHFVTTRILVVDMLKRRIPIDKITGFIVLRAHTIIESCQEAFCLRLYRISNKTGFVKAFSNSVQSFTMGFGHVERVMRTIFVKELSIWPRFHSLVNQSLKAHEPLVIELHVPISNTISKIQTCILELMDLTIKEIKKINKTSELQEITVENCLIKKFQKILQIQLDTIWHQLSSKSKQLVAELKTLRHLISSLLNIDSVTYYYQILQYRTKEYAQTSFWVLLDPAELLFTELRSLIYNRNAEFQPELCPKWKVLLDILKDEIPNDIKKTDRKENKILILCSDYRTCFQLKEILTMGPYQYLLSRALKYKLDISKMGKNFQSCGNIPENHANDESVESNKSDSESNNKKMKITTDLKHSSSEEEMDDFQNSYLLTMSQTKQINENNEEDYIFEPFEEMENMNITQICESLTAPTILIQCFHNFKDHMNLQRCLEDLQPSYVIMYHCDMTTIREIEMFEAHRKKDHPLKIFFLIHDETVEEQSYLTTLRREKEAFEFLIQTKSTMVVPEDQDGKSDLCQALQKDLKSPTKNSRHGGQSDEATVKRLIIIDMREFRSELPALIHKRGIEIEPVTITVGDYILTPEICVERKSLSDLVGSLNSGRLYQQCTQMCRYYAKPMLLIEFDQNKPFSWQNNYIISNDSNNFNIQQKLLLLTIHFPKLRIIWSPSPYASAQLFEELKDGKDEPSVEYTSTITEDEDFDVLETKYNRNIYDFIQKMPGINSKNIDGFLRNFQNLNGVINKNKEELTSVLGNSIDTTEFYSAIHDDHIPKDEALNKNNKMNKIKGKSLFKSKKFIKKK